TLHKTYEQARQKDERKEYHMFHEYPLEGKPPMMTHVFENKRKDRIIAAKGAPEAILHVSRLPESEKAKIREVVKKFGQKGYRILCEYNSYFEANYLNGKQQDLVIGFLDHSVFYAPLKKRQQQGFRRIIDAGI